MSMYDRRIVRIAGRTAATVAWMEAHPGAVCLVPTVERQNVLLRQYPHLAGRFIVPKESPQTSPSDDWVVKAFRGR